MNKLLKHLGLPALALAALALGSCSPKYEYETVPNDRWRHASTPWTTA